MNYTNDEFVESESWLAEKIFSHLKEYNPHGKDLLDPATTTDDAAISNNIVCNSSDNSIPNLSVSGIYAESNSGVNSTIVSLQYGDGVNTTNVAPATTFTEISTDLTNQEVSQIAWEAIANLNEESKDTVLVLDEEHTQRYLDLLKTTTTTAQVSYDVVNESVELEHEPDDGDDDRCAVQCSNCDQIFDEADFIEHVCDYDDNKILIKEDEEIKYSTVEEVTEPPCIRQLRENNARIRKFLKDELKIDLGGPTKKQDGPHECTMCERKFVHASGLVRHMEKHALDLIPVTTNSNQNGSGLKVVIKCLICGRIMFSTSEGLNHLLDAHEKSGDDSEEDTEHEEGVENIADEKLANAIGFVLKQLTYMEDGRKISTFLKVVILNSILQCEFCDYSFSEVSDLLLHESSHDPLRGFECSSCGISVQTSKEIFLHWQAECPYAKDESQKSVNLQKYFVCNVCENKFSSHEQLYDHRYSSYHLFPRLNKNLGIMQVGCEYCGIFHESAKSIMRHHEEKHIKKVKKESTTKYRQYLCDVCGKSYTQSSHLWQHLRFHRGVKPFACKEPGCNRRFTIRPDLNDHIRKCHTGERPYHCLVCGKRFLTGSVFYQHRLIHRGERRYGCEECGKRFYRADALKNHQRIHTGEKPYGCMYCNKSFRQRGDRDKHIRARHANLEANARSLAANSKDGVPNPGGVVYVGNVAFPTSMFKPMMRDIDENLYCDK